MTQVSRAGSELELATVVIADYIPHKESYRVYLADKAHEALAYVDEINNDLMEQARKNGWLLLVID